MKNEKMMNRITIRTLTFASVLLLLLAGCVKDDLHNTPHPDKGAVQVTADWSGRSSDADVPESHVLRIGEESQTVTGETNTFQSLLTPDSYRLLAYNTPEGITVAGNTATVNSLPDGTLTPQPEYLFCATRELNVIADDTVRVTLPMQQCIRSLTLTLGLAEGDKERIASTTATLTGIAHSLDLTTGKPTEGQTGGTVAPEFKTSTVVTPPTRAEGKPVLAAMLRLMGVVNGERQILTLAITLTDGYVQTITTDLSEALKDFGGDMEALALDAVLNLPVAGEVGGTITGWKEVDNGNIEIH